jgi:PAS domain S-box-containing protein
MRGTLSDDKRVALANQDFIILQHAKPLEFTGTWDLTDFDEEKETGDSFDYLINLNGTNYVIHPEDLPSFIEVINGLKSGNNVHLRVRVVSAGRHVMQLEAVGRIAVNKNPDRSLIESERRHAFFLALADALVPLSKPGDMQLVGCRLLAEHLTVSRVYYVEYKPEEGKATIPHDYVRGHEISRTGSFRIADLEPLTSMIANGEMSVVRDTFSSAEIPHDVGVRYSSRGIRSQVAVPLFSSGKLAAALVVTHSTAKQWTDFEISLIKETAERIWVVIQEAQHDAALRDTVKIYKDELLKSAELLRQSEEVASFGSWDFNLITEEFNWSDGMYKLFQLRPASPVTPEIYIAHAIDEDKEIAAKIVDHFRKDLQPFEETLRLRVDSKVKTIKVKGRVLYEGEKPTNFVGVDFDISLLVESRKALQEHYERLLEAQRIGQLGSYELDLLSNSVHWSEEMYSIMGIAPGVQLRFDDALSVYLPDDAERLRNLVKEAVATGGGFKLEAAFKKAGTRELRHISIAGKVVKDRRGRVVKVRGIAQDITDRKNSSLEIVRMKEVLAQHAETKYQQLFNSIDQGFCIIEMIFDNRGNPGDYKFLETNPAFEKQTGLTNLNGLTAKGILPDHDADWIEMYAQVVKKGSPVKSTKLALSSNRWYEVYAFPADIAYNNRVAVLFHDITERKVSEQELKKLYAELKELDNDKTNFFNNITHEFRTPLTLLLGPLADVIKKSGPDLPSRQRDQLLLAQRHALRLQKLVNSLLDFSRIEADQVDAVFSPINISAFTRDLAGSFRSAIEQAGLQFSVDCEDIHEPIYLNGPMFEKIVLNLLSNALKFTFEGKIEIGIRELPKSVELRVTDTGVGISSADRKQIFERFNRVQGARSRTYEGTGIGLALVKEMVKIHGGIISVKSELHQGSDFTVRFPKGKEHLPPGRISEGPENGTEKNIQGYLEEVKSWLYEPLVSQQDPNENEISSTVKPIVLLVDDNNDMRSYLAGILEGRYKVVKAENGEKALEIMALGLIPDLILTDVMMPVMDGYELLSSVRGQRWPKEIPVVLLTAQAEEESRIKGLHHGADDYLVKPFSSRELLARVESRIQITRLRHENAQILSQANKELESLVQQRTGELQANNEVLQHRNVELKAMNEELAGLTFAAGHDMREPLRKLRFFVHRLTKEEDANLSPAGKEYFRKIMSFVQMMSDLVSDLSLYSFYSNTPVHKSAINLDVMLFTLKEFLEPVLAEKKARLTVNVTPVLTGDQDQVKKLLYNLISNALKFRKPDSQLEIVVTGKILHGKFLEHSLARKDVSYYELEVRDNGIGFEQQYEKQIFQLFRKLHGRALSPGTGIGLTIVRKIAGNHGGFVTAKSSLGLGASFKCYFPMDNDDEDHR